MTSGAYHWLRCGSWMIRSALLLVTAVPVLAQAQALPDQASLTAPEAGRIGTRPDDRNAGRRRISSRVPTRIDTRLSTRLDNNYSAGGTVLKPLDRVREAAQASTAVQ